MFQSLKMASVYGMVGLPYWLLTAAYRHATVSFIVLVPEALDQKAFLAAIVQSQNHFCAVCDHCTRDYSCGRNLVVVEGTMILSIE